MQFFLTFFGLYPCIRLNNYLYYTRNYGDVPKLVRGESAKLLFGGSSPPVASEKTFRESERSFFVRSRQGKCDRCRGGLDCAEASVDAKCKKARALAVAGYEK